MKENLTAMMDKLHPACWDNAVWLFSPSCRKTLWDLSQAYGPEVQKYDGLVTVQSAKFYVMDRPAIITEKLPPIGTVGDCCLVDFSQYIAALRHDLRLEQSAHDRFSSDEITFKLKIRLGGLARWAVPITPRGGGSASQTLTWCVTLAAR